MIAPPTPADEVQRLAALHALGLLDTTREARFDRFTRLASRLLRVPYALISLIDSDRQWFKSAVGITACETSRNVSFCAHALTAGIPFVVPDALVDPRFCDNPLVTGEPNIRFYAGRVLQTPEGYRVGTLCVADTVPRELSAEELDTLNDLADLAEIELNSVALNDAVHRMIVADRERAEQKRVFDAFMDNSPGVVFIKDTESRYVFVNARFEEYFGQTNESIQGKRDEEWLPAEIAARGRETDRRIIETGRSNQRLASAPGVDGKLRQWLVVKFPIVVEGRTLIGGQAIDVTSEKEAERALQASEDRYRDLFENAGDMIGCLDATGRFLYVNPAWHHVHGYTHEELTALTFMDLVAPEDREHAAAVFRRVIGGSNLLGIQVHILTKDGRKLLIEGNASYSVENGQPVARGMFRDITSRHEAELSLQRLMTLKRAILESANSSIISTDQHGLILSFNPTAERWLGYTQEEAVGRINACTLHDPQEISTRSQELTRELGRAVTDGFEVLATKAQEGVADEREWTYVRKDGSRFPASVSVTALRDSSGKSFGFLSVARDITAEKAAEVAMRQAMEAAELANQTKSRFLANMSHEVRTPLNGILGVNAMLLETPLAEEQRHLAATVQESGESLLGIVNDILDFSKVESGLIELECTTFEVRPLLAEIQRLHSSRASANGLLIAIDVATDTPMQIAGDPVRVRQILSNFTSNAIKFSEGGTIVLRAAPEGEPTSSAVRMRFAVSDPGIGISPEAQERIFDPFQQADSSTTRKYGGTGLGLSICKQLVGLMGGEIGVQSAPQEGSTFWFTADFRRLDQPATPAAPAKSAERDDWITPGLRVLVVEDSTVNQLVIVHELRKLRCDVTTAGNGREAVERCTETLFDLLLMDCQMPEMDGYEAAGQIRQLTNANRQVPILAITANAMLGERERCLRAGMTDYVSKPFSREKLRAAVLRSVPSRCVPATVDSPVDLEEIATLRRESEMTGIDLLDRLKDAFADEVKDALSNLESALEQKDPERIGRIAHKLKGGAGNFGARALQRLCGELEGDARRNDIRSAAGRLDTVRRETDRVMSALKELAA